MSGPSGGQQGGPAGSDLIATVNCHSGFFVIAALPIRRLQSSKLKRTVGNAADRVIAPVWKIYPATSHAEQYITNSRYCGNLLW